MITFSAKSLRLLIATCALFFSACSGAWAMEQQFADDNCAITFPDDWHVVANMQSKPGVIAAYGDATSNRLVILQVYNTKPVGPLNDRFIAQYEQGIEASGGGNRLSGQYIEVGGIKSYERLGTVVSHGKNISTLGRLVPGENQYFNLLALRFDGDANDDPEIRQVVGSFRFIHPFTPSYASTPDSIAYRLGKLTGAGLVIIAVIVFVVVRSVRMNPKPRPPPLPPGGQ